MSDDGPGIPPELAEAVFLARCGARRPPTGEGLGLAISRGIVEAHGGSIVIEPTTTGTTMLSPCPSSPPTEPPVEPPSSYPSMARWPTMGDATCVLLVEDDRNIVDLIRLEPHRAGLLDVVSRDGEDVVELVESERPDLVAARPHVPGTSTGSSCAGRSASDSSVGIIVVSARGGEQDKVRALNLGADDYMTKPFGIDELLARIAATLRRTRPLAEPTGPEPRLVFGDLEIDLEARSVSGAGGPIRLTPTEFALLREFALNPGKLLSHATLLRRVWGPGYATETEYTRVYVRRLRAKLEQAGSPPLIVTEPRAGYRFVGSAGEPAAT